MIDQNPTIDSEDKKEKTLLYVRGEIKFKNIYFNYPLRPDTPILQGLNLIFDNYGFKTGFYFKIAVLNISFVHLKLTLRLFHIFFISFST